MPPPDARDFAFADGERLIRFGEIDEREVVSLLESRGFTDAVLLTGSRDPLPSLAEWAGETLRVPPGPVPEAAGAVRGEVGGRPLVALGGGRVIDSGKAIAGADGLRCAAIPTTLSGAEMTPFHRMPAGVEEWKLVRPELVVTIPSLVASQPMPELAASAMNALAHAIEALYTPMAGQVSDEAALRGVTLVAHGLAPEEPRRTDLALGALWSGYASGLAGFAVHHAVCQTIVRLARTPHAQTNAVMLPHFVRFMEPRAPEAMAKVAGVLPGDVHDDVSNAIAALSGRAAVKRLGELGVSSEEVDGIVTASLGHPALANTPSPPDREELLALLQRAL